MKKTKLPTLEKKKNPLTKWVGYFLFSLVIVAAISVSFYQPIIPPLTVILDKPIDIKLVTASEIIARDGGLDKNTATQYAKWIFESGYKYGVDPLLILSVMNVESRFKSDAISGANAIGLMQVIHRWHKDKTTQADLFLPQNNIDVGTKILAEYSRRSSTETETLLRYNGAVGKKSTYPSKVLNTKDKYKTEIMIAMK